MTFDFFLSVILLFEHFRVCEVNSSLSRWKWHFCFIMYLLSKNRTPTWFLSCRHGPSLSPSHKLGEWLMVAEAEEEKRDVRRINLCAPSVLVSCLLFYRAFRSRPSAPRGLICQMGFHLHLQDVTNLPFIATSPHRTVCQDGSKSSLPSRPADNRLQPWRTSACVVLIALTRQNL